MTYKSDKNKFLINSFLRNREILDKMGAWNIADSLLSKTYNNFKQIHLFIKL
jgi:hypothetical protein